MYPLDGWKTFKRGYHFSQKTFYSEYHLGLDVICPVGTPLRAWNDITITQVLTTKDCGNYCYIVEDGKPYIFRPMHLRERPKAGRYAKGSIFAYSGNTGSLSTAPHLHIDISKNKVNIYDINNFIDPEVYFLNLNNMLKLKIDSAGNQYLADEELKIAVSIPDEEQLIEVSAFHDFGSPELFDPAGWLVFKGGTDNWWNSKFNRK